MNQLQENVSPLARNEQKHRKNQAADTRDFESERTDNATVRWSKAREDEPAGVQGGRCADQEDYAGDDQRLEASRRSSESRYSDRYCARAEAQSADSGNDPNRHLDESRLNWLQQETH